MAYYLYGHYNSRGGAWLIEADTKAQADAQYLESFFTQDEEWASKAEQDKQILDEDFIAEVAFSAYREVKNGEDLEQGEPRNEHGTLTNDEIAIGRAFEDGLAWADYSVSREVPNPVWELLWARYDEEDMETPVELRLHPAGQSPAYEDWRDAETPTQHHFPAKPKKPGWRRAEFGEDACGVVFTKKEI